MVSGIGGGPQRGDFFRNLYPVILFLHGKAERKTPILAYILYTLAVFGILALIPLIFWLIGLIA